MHLSSGFRAGSNACIVTSKAIVTLPPLPLQSGPGGRGWDAFIGDDELSLPECINSDCGGVYHSRNDSLSLWYLPRDSWETFCTTDTELAGCYGHARKFRRARMGSSLNGRRECVRAVRAGGSVCQYQCDCDAAAALQGRIPYTWWHSEMLYRIAYLGATHISEMGFMALNASLRTCCADDDMHVSQFAGLDGTWLLWNERQYHWNSYCQEIVGVGRSFLYCDKGFISIRCVSRISFRFEIHSINVYFLMIWNALDTCSRSFIDFVRDTMF